MEQGGKNGPAARFCRIGQYSTQVGSLMQLVLKSVPLWPAANAAFALNKLRRGAKLELLSSAASRQLALGLTRGEQGVRP
jgi:hypothetical protein